MLIDFSNTNMPNYYKRPNCTISMAITYMYDKFVIRMTQALRNPAINNMTMLHVHTCNEHCFILYHIPRTM